MKKRNIFNIIVDGEEVGSLFMENGKIKFTGNADESAKIFVEQVINYYSNDSGDADWWKKCDE
jgi:hypothetical protein